METFSALFTFVIWMVSNHPIISFICVVVAVGTFIAGINSHEANRTIVRQGKRQDRIDELQKELDSLKGGNDD